MGQKKKRKALWIVLVCLVLCAAIGVGLWYVMTQKGTESVYVYPFTYLGMTEYWGDTQESYGPVSTKDIQTVFLSATQTVTKIAVNQGDTVKKGDLLLTYDTTLTDIALERERLNVEKLKLDLQNAYTKLSEIKAMKPMVLPEPKPETPENTDPGTPLEGAYQISGNPKFDGSGQEKAIICWLSADSAVSREVLDALKAAALTYQTKNGTVSIPKDPAAPADPTEPTEEPGEEPGEEPTEAPTEPEVSTEPEVPTEPDPTEPAETDLRFYVILKTTQGDTSKGEVLLWQGMSVTYEAATGDYRFWLYDADGFADHTLEDPAPEETEPEIDYGSGYTAAQIAEMRSQQEKAIRDLQFQIKMAEANYKIKQTEVADGNIYAQIDGTVVSLLTPEEALQTQQPVMKVSSGGGYYVEGFVTEFQRDTLQLGQEVTVTDWQTGMQYTGQITEVSDYPLPDDGGIYGNGNPNSSRYPFTAFIDGEADLQAGFEVSIALGSAGAQQGLYLENPYLRTEQGKTYVYVRGADGLLEKRYVTTGKSLWGSYTEILEGLTAEDLLAFPYGKAVKPGAPAVESDYSTLYG